jgi:hypothetical protein
MNGKGFSAIIKGEIIAYLVLGILCFAIYLLGLVM